MATIREVLEEYRTSKTLEGFMKETGLTLDDEIGELQKTLKSHGKKECHKADLYVDEKISQKIWDICDEFNVDINYKWQYKGW